MTEPFNPLEATDEECNTFLENIRWGGNICCLFCGHKKTYRLNTSHQPLKCANKKCGKKFSIKNESLIHNSKLSIKDWLCFIWHRSQKRTFSIMAVREMTFSSEFIVNLKIGELFSELPSKLEVGEYNLFLLACKKLFSIHKDKVKLPKTGKKIIDDSEIIDFSDKPTYTRIVFFSRLQLYNSNQRRYILHVFCDAEEIVAEAFILLADQQEVAEITGAILIKALRRSQYLLWKEYVNSNPKLKNWIKQYINEWKRNSRRSLGSWYVKELIGREEWSKYGSKKELHSIIEQKRNEIIQRRKKTGVYYEPPFT